MLTQGSHFTKLQRLKLVAATHYFVVVTAIVTYSASAYPQVKGAQVQNFYRSYPAKDSARKGKKAKYGL